MFRALVTTGICFTGLLIPHFASAGNQCIEAEKLNYSFDDMIAVMSDAKTSIRNDNNEETRRFVAELENMGNEVFGYLAEPCAQTIKVVHFSVQDGVDTKVITYPVQNISYNADSLDSEFNAAYIPAGKIITADIQKVKLQADNIAALGLIAEIKLAADANEFEQADQKMNAFYNYMSTKVSYENEAQEESDHKALAQYLTNRKDYNAVQYVIQDLKSLSTLDDLG